LFSINRQKYIINLNFIQMKKEITKFLALALFIPLLFMGCQKTDLVDESKTTPADNNGSSALKSTIVYCGDPKVVNLRIWDNPIECWGTVTVGNDQTNLYVTYQAASGILIGLTDLYVGPEAGIPGYGIGNGIGQFDISQFPYHSSHPWPMVQTYTYTLPLAELEDCFAVVAHAVVRAPDGTAKRVWGYEPMVLYWGYFFNYCKQECPEPVCETAYAYGETFANCFLTIPGVNSNNWGWSNGPVGAGIYEWPIYAGAGQCNIGVGVHIGTLTVNYAPPTAIVTYTMFNGNILNSTHLYVGNQILPRKNGKFTTAPGQFPYKHNYLNGVPSDTFTISGLSGNIYVVAHSDACYYE
jgi:hypothetical protein